MKKRGLEDVPPWKASSRVEGAIASTGRRRQGVKLGEGQDFCSLREAELPRAGSQAKLEAVRFAVLLAGALAAYYAPLQCAKDPDPSLRRYETPGEALYGLAQEFKAKGDEAAWRATLSYLTAHYPNSRFAAMARDDLEKRSTSSGSRAQNADGDHKGARR